MTSIGVTRAEATIGVFVGVTFAGATRLWNKLTCGRGTKNTTTMAAATAMTTARWVQDTCCHLPRGSTRPCCSDSIRVWSLAVSRSRTSGVGPGITSVSAERSNGESVMTLGLL